MEEKEVMLGVPQDLASCVNLFEHRAMVYLPENCVEAEIRCKVFQDGELLNVSKKMTMSDLRNAFQKADDGYIDDDDVFTLTDKGREYLEKLERER